MKFLIPVIRMFRRAYLHWRVHNPTLLAAGLSYFALFSLVPLTVLTISLIGQLFAGAQARDLVLQQMTVIFGVATASSIATLLGHVDRSAGSASLVSAVLLAWVGSRMFTQLQVALSSVWDIVPEKRTRLGKLRAYAGDRLRAMAATVGMGALAFAFLVMDVVLAQFRKLLMDMFPEIGVLRILPVISLLVSLVLFAVAFAMIYRWLPARHPGWQAIWTGAGVASVLFAIGRVAMAIYFNRKDISTLLGAAGSVAVILIWVYYSMQILLFGATVAAAVGEKNQNPHRNPLHPIV